MFFGCVHCLCGALTPHTPPPPPARPPTPCPARPPHNTWLRHATETHRANQWEIDRLVDGVGDSESPAHAPRFPYRLGKHGTVWRFGLMQWCCKCDGTANNFGIMYSKKKRISQTRSQILFIYFQSYSWYSVRNYKIPKRIMKTRFEPRHPRMSSWKKVHTLDLNSGPLHMYVLTLFSNRSKMTGKKKRHVE